MEGVSRMKKLEVIFLDGNEFNKLVHENFPERSDYECTHDIETETYHFWTGVGTPIRYKEDTPPEKIKEFKEFELKRFDDWLQKKDYSGVGTFQILSALHRKGVIEAGNYLIDILC